MRRRTLTLALFVFSLLTPLAVAAAPVADEDTPTVEQILAGSAEARGGADPLKLVTT